MSADAKVVANEVTAALQFAGQVALLFPGVGSVLGPVLQLAPEAIGLVTAVMNMAAQNRGPTEEEKAALDAHIADNSRAIHEAAERARVALAGQGGGG